jgi:hypothetical protein
MALYTVTTQAELASAQSSLAAGDRVEMVPTANRVPYIIQYYTPDNTKYNNVTFTSRDPKNKAIIGRLYGQFGSGTRFWDLAFDSTGPTATDNLTPYHKTRGTPKADIWLQNCSSPQVVRCEMTGSARLPVSVENRDVAEATDGVVFNICNDILFRDNFLSSYNFGLKIQKGTGTHLVLANEFTGMQADVCQFSGFENLIYDDNYSHSHLGAEDDVTHPDMVQVHEQQGDFTSFIARRNIFDGRKNISNYQSFFCGNKGGAGVFGSILIEDNLIFGNHLNGIRVEQGTIVVIRRNALLGILQRTLTSINRPTIVITDYTDSANVNNNIAHAIAETSSYSLAAGVVQSGNIVLENSIGDGNINPNTVFEYPKALHMPIWESLARKSGITAGPMQRKHFPFLFNKLYVF